MKYCWNACLLLTLAFNSFAYADCQPAFQDEIDRISNKLISFKKKEKKIEIGVAIGAGAPVAILGGVAFGLITDGATIPTAILSGAMFGTFTGGIAAGAVAVPLITYNQIQKARIRALVRITATLDEASQLNEDGKHLKKLLKQMRREYTDLDMAHLITAINQGNSENIFCSDPENLDHLKQLKKHIAESAE